MWRAPLFYVLIPLCVGIVVGEYWPLWSWWPILISCVVLLVIATVGTAFHRWQSQWGEKIFLVLLFCAIVAIGYTLRQCAEPGIRSQHYSHHLVAYNNQRSVSTMAVFRLLDEPTPTRRAQKSRAQVVAIRHEGADTTLWVATRGTAMLFFPTTLPQSLHRGDTLLARASFSIPTDSLGSDGFNYRRYLHRQGILHTVYLDSGYFHVFPTHSGFRQRIDRFRYQLTKIIHGSNLSEDNQGVAQALLLGYDDEITDSDRQHFRDAGVAHILCVSGLHVGIVAAILGWLLVFVSGTPALCALRGLLQLAGVWFFTLLTGMAPATLRASIMFSFLIVGRTFFHRPSSLNDIAASALVLLVSQPMLLFQVGFQLSYAAVMGILTLQRPLQNLVRPLVRHIMPYNHVYAYTPHTVKKVLRMGALWLARKVWSMVCLTTAAQLSTLPFVLYYFHQFPLYFLVANLLIVPFAGVLLMSVLLLLLLSVWSWAFHVMTAVVESELRLVNNITAMISSWPHATLTLSHFTQGEAFVLGSAIAALMVWSLSLTKCNADIHGGGVEIVG